MRKSILHDGTRRRIVAVAFGIGTAASACTGGDGSLFRHPITESGQLEGALRVSEADTYSVAIEAVVAASLPGARQQAWMYLATPDASSPLRIGVAIQKDDGTPVFSGDAVDPEMSSWNSGTLYLEVARVNLPPGHYRIRSSQTGKRLDRQPGFTASLVVVPAYQGK